MHVGNLRKVVFSAYYNDMHIYDEKNPEGGHL
jgi:hypothetical protein